MDKAVLHYRKSQADITKPRPFVSTKGARKGAAGTAADRGSEENIAEDLRVLSDFGAGDGYGDITHVPVSLRELEANKLLHLKKDGQIGWLSRTLEASRRNVEVLLRGREREERRAEEAEALANHAISERDFKIACLEREVNLLKADRDTFKGLAIIWIKKTQEADFDPLTGLTKAVPAMEKLDVVAGRGKGSTHLVVDLIGFRIGER